MRPLSTVGGATSWEVRCLSGKIKTPVTDRYINRSSPPSVYENPLVSLNKAGYEPRLLLGGQLGSLENPLEFPPFGCPRGGGNWGTLSDLSVVSRNSGFYPKSSILIGCLHGVSIIFTIHFGVFPLFLETHI